MLKKLGFLTFVVLLLMSCKQISSIPNKILSSEEKVTILVDLETNENINPNDYNNLTQPTKVCFFIAKEKDWVPKGIYDGIPCQDQESSERLIDYKDLMVLPSKNYQIQFDVIYNRKDQNELWLIVGANFQKINDFQPIDKILINKKKYNIKIPIQLVGNKINILDKESFSNNKNEKNGNTNKVLIF